MTTLEAQVKELSEGQSAEEKAAAAQLEMTPAASLAAIISAGVIGNPLAQVDGRTARHDAPKETKAAPAAGEILNSGNSMADNIINTILEPTGAWLEDLPKQ